MTVAVNTVPQPPRASRHAVYEEGLLFSGLHLHTVLVDVQVVITLEQWWALLRRCRVRDRDVLLEPRPLQLLNEFL